MLGLLDGDGFGMDDAEQTLEQDQGQGKVREMTEKYGFDAALGLAAGAAGPEVAAGAAAAYGSMTAGEYAAEKAENPDYAPVKDKAKDIYDGAKEKVGDFQDEYGEISLGMLDDDRNHGAVTV
jgi:hypothetical protein